MTRMKAAKLLYLADLRSIEQDGIKGSGVAWRWREFGPFDDELLKIERALSSQGRIEVNQTRWGVGNNKRNDVRALTTSSSLVDNGDDFLAHIESILEEYGSWNATQLKNHTYKTIPMIEAQENEAVDELLDFTATGHLTLADIDASAGKGPWYDSEDSTFYASDDEFLASLNTDQDVSDI